MSGAISDAIGTVAGAIGTATKAVGKAVKSILSLTTLVSPKYAYVQSKECLLRSAPPELESYGVTVPVDTKLKVLKKVKTKSGKKVREYVYVTEILPEDFVGPRQYEGWTLASNLKLLDTPMSFKLAKGTQKFADAVLRKVGQDPHEWFAGFTHTSFLGRPTATPIHQELADHLKTVEAGLVADHSGGTGDPVVAGNNLGLSPKVETIKGGRKEATSASRSMHFFGLAIDLDYTENPYISESENDDAAINAVFPRASALVHGKETKFQKAPSESAADMAKTTDLMFELDETLETYFSYLDDDAALETRLKAAAASGAKFWSTQDVAGATKRIKADLTWLAGVWRAGRNAKSFTETVKTGGFMNFERELVDGIDLHWGGTYGDMMHFDMRNAGTGKKIATARHAVPEP